MAVVKKDAWVEFFTEFRNMPELWKIESIAYKNKDLRNKSYKRLLEVYKKIESDANMDTLRNKLNNLKTSYRRELKKIRQSVQSGASKEDLYTTSLWYFHLLDFLKDQGSKIIKRKKVCDNPSITQKFLSTATAQLKDLKQCRDEGNIYAEGWAVSYNKLSTEQKLYAKKAIDEILLIGQFNQLSLNVVSIPSSLGSSRNLSRASTPYIYDTKQELVMDNTAFTSP